MESKISFRKFIRYTIISAAAFAAIGITLFLWKTQTLQFGEQIDSKKFGEFGSYLGGVLGTLFSGLAFILLLQTYSLQRETVQQNLQEKELSNIDRLYENIISDINNLSFTNNSNQQRHGTDCFYYFDINSKNPVMDHLNGILFSVTNLVDIIKNAKHQDQETKRVTLTRVYFMFYGKVLWPVENNILKKRRELIETHDDSKFIFERFDTLSTETQKFLSQQNLIAEK